jgi:hypothetical protein
MRIGIESRKAETIVTADISLGPSEFSFITLCRIFPDIFAFFSDTLHPGNDVARFYHIVYILSVIFMIPFARVTSRNL